MAKFKVVTQRPAGVTFDLADEQYELERQSLDPIGAEIFTSEASTEEEFIRDAKQRVKEILTRGYIDPEHGTLDYVLLFIPNEQVYGFIHEHAPDFLDDALRQKVVLCSPYTLFAILGVIRQTLENFNLSQKTNEILQLQEDKEELELKLDDIKQ